MTLEDPWQKLLGTANHEAGHAVGFFHYGWAIDLIDIARDRHVLGHVVPAARGDWLVVPPGLEGDELRAHVDGQVFHDNMKWSVIARLGTLFAAQDWRTQDAGDRALVLACCPRQWSAEGWEILVESRAQEILDDPRYQHAHRMLAGELLKDRYRPMPGDRAREIFDQALAAYDREHIG